MTWMSNNGPMYGRRATKIKHLAGIGVVLFTVQTHLLMGSCHNDTHLENSAMQVKVETCYCCPVTSAGVLTAVRKRPPTQLISGLIFVGHRRQVDNLPTE